MTNTVQKTISRGGKMINFNYKGNKYTIFFYPCGNMVRIAKDGRTRDLKYNNNTKVKTLLETLDKITF